MGKGRKIEISDQTPEEAFGIPNESPITPGRNMDTALSEESLTHLADTQGGFEKGVSINNAGDLFRLQGGNFTVDEAIDYNATLSANQGYGEQLWNMGKNAIPTIAAGFLDNFNYDVPDMTGLASGTEKEYGNWLSEITSSLRKMGDAPIYQEGDSLADPTYWIKQAQNFAYTGGLVAGAFAEQAALTYLSAQTLGGAAPVQAASWLSKGKLLKNALFGTWKGVHEGYINGLETFEGVKEKYLDLGYSHTDAIKYASEAAALGYKMEVGPLMLLNALQFGMIGKASPFSKAKGINAGFSGSAEALTDYMFKGIKNKKAKAVLGLGTQMGTESIEEAIQTGVSKYAEYKTLKSTNDVFLDFELWDAEMRDSMIGGAFGGGIFAGMGAITDKIGDNTVAKVYGKMHDNFIAGVGKRIDKNLTAIAKAEKEGDTRAVDAIKFKMQRDNVFESLQLDYLNQKETAFDSYISTLEGTLEAIQNQDTEVLRGLGLTTEEDLKHVIDNFPDIIAQAKSIKEKFTKAYEKSNDFTVASTIADSQQVLEDSVKYEKRNNAELEKLVLEDPLLQSLEASQREYIQLHAEAAAIANRKEVTPKQHARYKEIEARLGEINQEEEWGAEKTALVHEYDYTDLTLLHYDNLELEVVKNESSKRINEWSKPEKVAEIKKERAVAEVKNAKTKEELVKAKEKLETEGIVDPNVTEVINDKIEQAEVKEVTGEAVEAEVAFTVNDEGKVSEERRGETRKIENLVGLADLEEAQNGNTEALTNDENYDEFFQPSSLPNMSEATKKKLGESVKSYVESMKLENMGTSFRDFIKDYIIQNEKDSTDRIYNALVEGWKAAGFEEVDFNQVYNDLFRDRKSIHLEILGLVENEETKTNDTAQEEKKANQEAFDKAKDKAAPTVELDQDTNQTSIKDTPTYKAVSTGLRAAHISLPHDTFMFEDEDGTLRVIREDTSDDLVNATEVNSTKLLDPNKFHPGTRLTVRIPPNYKDIRVQVWEDAITKSGTTTFGEWMEANNVTEGSPEWYAKVPMIATDNENEGVFLIHDKDWYSPLNIGFEHDPKKQGEIIKEAQATLMNFRNKFKENKSVEIKITEKRPGMLKKISKDKPTITINQANPHSQMAIANNQGEIILNGEERFEKDGRVLINRKRDFRDGHFYNIRQTGDGKYIALEVLRKPFRESLQNTLYNIIANYVSQKEPSRINQNMRDKFLSITETDMFDTDEIAPIVKQYAMVTYIKGDTTRIIPHIESRILPKIKDGDAYLAFHGNAIVFGIKGQKVNGKSYIRLYPEDSKIGDPAYLAGLEADLKVLRENVMPRLKPNISKLGLADNRKMAKITADGDVLPDGDYRDHLKNNLDTSIMSYNVGTKDKPVYATMIQPVITYEAVEDSVDVANPTPSKVAEIKKKDTEGETLTNQEEAIKQSANEEFTEPVQDNLELIEALKATMKSLLDMGISPSDPDIIAIQKQLEDLGDSFDSPYPLTSQETLRMKEDVGDNVPGLSIRQNFQIVDYIFNEISKKLDFKYGAKIDKQEALNSIKKSYMEMIGPGQKENKATLDNLKRLAVSNPALENLVKRLETEGSVYDSVNKNWKTLEKFAMAKVRKFTGIKESKLDIEIETVEDQGLTVKNYSKSALEEGGKTTSSYRLKRFLAGVKVVGPDGKVKTGFLGVPLYVGFDKAYGILETVFSSPQSVESDFSAMMVRLEENVKTYPWLRQVIEQLKTADDQIKNELVYNFTRHTLSMKFVMFSKNRNGNYTLKVYDTNSTEITRVIRDSWTNNFIASPNNLVFVENGVHKLNKERAAYLLEKFDKWKDKITLPKGGDKGRVDISNTELREWLDEFGISLSDETISEMRNKEVTYLTKDGKEKMVFSTLFEKKNNTEGIFGLLAHYLDVMVKTDDTTIDDTPQNHPFTDATNVLKTISRIESKYSMNATTNTFRDGGKSIYGFTPTKFATDMVNRLKFDTEGYRSALLNKPFSQHSFFLKLIDESENFRNKLYVDHIGITALKELGKRVFGDNNSITDLSDSDHELTKLGLFQDTEQGELKEYFDEKKSIPLRMARMFFPTMSDKSQMLSLYTAVLNLRSKHFNIDNGAVSMTDGIVEALYSQTVLPELERITNYIAKHKAKGTDIKGYDFAAQMFLMIPELNNMVDEETGKSVLSLMINAPGKHDKAWFEKNMKDKVKEIISSVVDNEVTTKMAEWEDSGITVKNEKDELVPKYLNEKYLNGFRGSPVEKIKMSAFDFVINSLITNANINMTVAGDIAMYSQDKIKKYFENGKPYLPKAEYGRNAYALAVKEISTNVGKRLALLLAPGSKIANSIGERYNQIFLNDQFASSNNLDFLADLFENKRLTDAEKQVIAAFNEHKSLNTEMPNKVKEAFSNIEKKFPKIAPYFSIEATDAQEYTTVREHVDILWRQGRLHSTHHTAILAKIASGKDFTGEEMELILQPIKPVHTGFKEEDRFDAMRMMYIKTSSFPLIPQITKGSELDKVRQLLEKKEKDTGMSVRASYQSGNKVGGVTNPLAIFNHDGTFNDKVTEQEIAGSTLVLDRDNFRIQQDVPFKSGKNKKDQVSLGTQTLKLLFGDGMMDLEGFEYNGETINGKDLAKRFADNFDNYTKLRRNMLFKELGMDKEGNPIDTEKTMLKLQDLLKREAEDRGYPRQDIEALSLTMMTNLKDEKGFTVSLPIDRVKKLKSGNLTTVEIEDLKKEVGEKAFKAIEEGNYTAQDVQFTLPLWMSPNSNRYESLLNAIVTNRLVKVKMPGNAYVLGSEGGFRFQKDMKGVDESKIIYLDSWEGQLKAADYHEGGKLKKTQVLLPSKFRDNKGNLINLLTDEYTYRDGEGVLRLREGKIDPSLLNITSFRIPTSGHVSMSQVEIVGILPPEVGDLMIVPKNLSVQKGLDYDVDKETTYHLHTYTDDNGNIRPFDEAARQAVLKESDKWGDNPEDNLFRGIFGEDVDFDLSELEPGEKLDMINDKLQQKIYENEFVKIHGSVLSNNSLEVQQKINKVLSMEFAGDQAEMVDAEVTGAEDNTYFTMLSDTYQKKKMALGASGKLGIGVYSNYVVFHSMVQQSDKKIQLQTRDEDGDVIPFKIQIGTQISTGELGRTDSLAPMGIRRSIADVFAERQNTATDNEKEQIMGRLNINGVTINVDSLLSALGFDKDMWEITKEEFEANKKGAYEKNGSYYRVGSLPYMILSQPIIREYVEAMNKTQSNTQEYDKFAEDRIIEKLYADYQVGDEYDATAMPSMLTGKELFSNLTKPSPAIQTEVLRLFLDLHSYAKNASFLQSRMNINDSGLGKSFFETIEKYEGVQSIISDIEHNKKGFMISNVSSLVGEYVKIDRELNQNAESELRNKGWTYNIYTQSYQGGKELTPMTRNELLINGFVEENNGFTNKDNAELLKQGYVPFDKYLIKPTTPVGSMLVNAVSTGYDMWNSYFPYNDQHVIGVTNEIMNEISDESASSSKVLERQQHVFQEMKKFFVTSERLGTFVGDPSTERFRLFMDKGETKKSLANYLRNLMKDKSAVYEILKNNNLLSRFQFDINRNGLPSTIKFDNTKGENFDEDYLYMALIELIDVNIPLPAFNGQEYTTRDLAQDLIAYNYLEGGIQQAVQFTKYIPVSYLNTIPFGKTLREWNNQDKPQIFYQILGRSQGGRTSKFARQYFQNNPQRLPKVDTERQTANEKYFGDKTDLDNLISFEANIETMSDAELKVFNKLKYVSIYNPDAKKGTKKFLVFEKDGDSFRRISALGVFGMAEYSLKESDAQSIVNDSYMNPAPAQPTINPKRESTLGDPFFLRNGTVKEIIDSLKVSQFSEPHLKPLLDALLPYMGDVKIELRDLKRLSRGKYVRSENTIVVDEEYYSTFDKESIAQTIVHELIHALTVQFISQYVDSNGNLKPGVVAPKEILDLVLLFSETRKVLGPEWKAYVEKRAKQKTGETTEGTTERERTVAYAGFNIYEFVAIALSEPNFQMEMKDKQYKESSDSIMDRLAKIVQNILVKVLGDAYVPGTITTDAVRVSLEIVKAQANQNKKLATEAEIIAKQNAQDAKLAGDENEVLFKLDQPSENPTFVIPFNCK